MTPWRPFNLGGFPATRRFMATGPYRWDQHHLRKVQADDVLWLLPLQSGLVEHNELYQLLTPRLKPETVVPSLVDSGAMIPVGRLIGRSRNRLSIKCSAGREYFVREPSYTQYAWNMPTYHVPLSEARATDYKDHDRSGLPFSNRYRRLRAAQQATETSNIDEPVTGGAIASSKTSSIILPNDAEFIVRKLLSLNLPNYAPSESEKFAPIEILEAGTGTGSLTLALAIEAQRFNGAPPQSLTEAVYQESRACIPKKENNHQPRLIRFEHEFDSALQSEVHLAGEHRVFLDQRHVVITSVEMRAEVQAQARKNVRDFCRGQYLLNVDFYVDQVQEHLKARLSQNSGEPFLGGAILDLPSIGMKTLKTLTNSLLPGGRIIVHASDLCHLTDLEHTIKTLGTHRSLRNLGCHMIPHHNTMEGSILFSVSGRADDSEWARPRPHSKFRRFPGQPQLGGVFIRVYEKVTPGHRNVAR